MTEETVSDFDSVEENNFSETENEFSDDGDKKVLDKLQPPPLPYTLTLGSPVSVGKFHIDTITFKRPLTSAMIKHLPTDPTCIKMGHFHKLVVGMTGELSVVVDALAVNDFQRCMNIVNKFF